MIEGLRNWLNDPHQIWAHRNGFSDFTRKRRFGFQATVLLVLQKSAKSIQVHLNEFFCAWAPEQSVAPTASAWTQARAKLSASAFVAMNRQVVLEEFYQPDNPQQLWRGHRLLAIDGSEARLPESEELADYFGLIKPVNQKRTRGAPYILGRVTVIYDVLNRMMLEGVLSRYTVGEIQLGEQLLANTRAGDVILCDRGFCGYGWLATILQWGRDFICRVPRRSFGAAEALYKAGRAGVSLEVWLEPPPAQRARYRAMGYPLRLRVRLVTLLLPTGELEVLVTSLLSPRKYPLKALSQAYGLRWGVEECQTQSIKTGWCPLRHFFTLTMTWLRGRGKRERVKNVHLFSGDHDFFNQALRHGLSLLKGKLLEVLPQQPSKGLRIFNDLLPMHGLLFGAG